MDAWLDGGVKTTDSVTFNYSAPTATNYIGKMVHHNNGSIYSPFNGKISEIIAALTFTAIFRTLIGLVPAALLAIPLFDVSIFKIGIPLIFLLVSLYIFGVTLGLLVTSGLIRFGPSFENIAWASLFFLAPLGCIYYPIEILPEWLQFIAKFLPLVHLFEEMRNILINDLINYFEVLKACIISFIYFIGGVIIFYYSYAGAKERGTLINMGE